MIIQRSVLLGFLVAFSANCSKDKSDGSPKSEPVAKVDSVAPIESEATNTPKKKQVDDVGKDLLSEPVERRLYTERIEASSFLWVNYNRFQENYHANYIMDGDPATAWIEGADGDGHGEWVRIRTSKVAGATQLRLRLQNGYHKTKKLFKQNARLKELQIKVLPSGQVKNVTLADNMDWVEIVVDLSSDTFSGVELQIADTYSGSKYGDTCISEVEVYVTARTPENPAFEARKLAKLQSWKAVRRNAATVFASASGKSLPIKSGYRVKSGPGFTLKKMDGVYPAARAVVLALQEKTGEQADVFEKARAALKSKFKGWKSHRIAVRKPIALPPVDGLITRSVGSVDVHWPSDAFVIPRVRRKSLVQAKSISLFEGKADFDPSVLDSEEGECDPDVVWAMRPSDEIGPTVRELLIWSCFESEDRSGTMYELSWQLLGYDENGWLRLTVGFNHAQYFDWKPGEQGMILEGGTRAASWKKARMQFLTSVAPPN